MTAPMTAAAADWVYDVVLTQRYKESVGAIMWTGAREKRRDEGKGAAFLRVCPCQYGPCGHCSDGRHDRASCRTWRPGPSPATRIVSLRGHALAEVWRTGRPCAWRCPCDCPVVDPEQRAEVAPEQAFEQMNLFELAGGAR